MAYKQKGFTAFTKTDDWPFDEYIQRGPNWAGKAKRRRKWRKFKQGVKGIFTRNKKNKWEDDFPYCRGCVDNSRIDVVNSEVKPYKPPPRVSEKLPPIDWDSEVYN